MPGAEAAIRAEGKSKTREKVLQSNNRPDPWMQCPLVVPGARVQPWRLERTLARRSQSDYLGITEAASDVRTIVYASQVKCLEACRATRSDPQCRPKPSDLTPLATL